MTYYATPKPLARLTYTGWPSLFIYVTPGYILLLHTRHYATFFSRFFSRSESRHYAITPRCRHAAFDIAYASPLFIIFALTLLLRHVHGWLPALLLPLRRLHYFDCHYADSHAIFTYAVTITLRLRDTPCHFDAITLHTR